MDGKGKEEDEDEDDEMEVDEEGEAAAVVIMKEDGVKDTGVEKMMVEKEAGKEEGPAPTAVEPALSPQSQQ
eukprot:evm.model.NODE_24576_length_1095_cov_7.485845.1